MKIECVIGYKNKVLKTGIYTYYVTAEMQNTVPVT